MILEIFELNYSVVEEARNDDVIYDGINEWLEEFVDKNLNRHFQEIGKPSNDCNHEVS